MAGEISPIKIAVVLDTAKLETQLRGTSGKISRGLGGNGAAGGVGNGGFGQGKVGGWASNIAQWLGIGGIALKQSSNERSSRIREELRFSIRYKSNPNANAGERANQGLAYLKTLNDFRQGMAARAAEGLSGFREGPSSPLQTGGLLSRMQGKTGALLGMFGKPGKALAKLGGIAGGPLGALGLAAGAAALGVGTLAGYNSNVTSGIGGTVASFNPRSSIGMNALGMQKAYAATTPKAPAGFMSSFGASVGPAGQGSLDAISSGLGLFTNGALWGSALRAIPELALGGLGLLAGMDGPTMVPEQVGAKQVGNILKDTFDQWYVRNLGNASEQRQMKRQMQRQANIAERNAI
jgi:hypothetical protein